MSADAVIGLVTQELTHNPVIVGLLILVLFTLIQDFFLFRRFRRFLRGGDGKSLEGTIKKLSERVSVLEAENKKLAAALGTALQKLKRSIQGVSVKRFDPFQNAGGQQSFSTTFLNEEGSGVVISGIHSRDGVRVYAKPVTKFSSERELSAEEQSSIDETKKNLGYVG